MTILDKIIQHKQAEIEERKSLYPVKLLEKSLYFQTAPVSLKKYLTRADKTGIIAEFKTKSPSKGDINPYADVEQVTIGYMQAGASALSILTDNHFFGGSFDHLILARKFNYCPILQKDFIIDPYQIIEAKSYGADAILLIAACLTNKQIGELTDVAKSLNLEIIMEIHSKEELNKLNPQIDVVGINNRDLKSFKVDLSTSEELVSLIPNDFIKISESGIKSVDDILRLREKGIHGFLIGESFMKHSRPEQACMEFIRKLKSKEKTNQQNSLNNEIESMRFEKCI